MTFKEFATKYLDPAVQLPDRSLSFLLKDSGLDDVTVLKFINFAQTANYGYVLFHNAVMPLADLITAWEAANPPGFYRNTPFGDGSKEFVPLAGMKTGDLTAAELHDLMVDAVKAALGK